MSRRVVRIVSLSALVIVAGCAYFNALYNARRLYDDAQAATDRGELTAAAAAHRESLEKAARSLERDPDGRWSDDALLLIGRNQFSLGDCRAADGALRRVLRVTSDADLAAIARAYLGAAVYCLERPDEAASYLDQSLVRLEPGTATEAFARLWRARARFELGRPDSAWADLAHAADRRDGLGRAASLEQIGRAIAHDRRDLAMQAFHRLLGDPSGDLHADSVRRLAQLIADRWGGADARAALEPAQRAPWAGDVRDRLVIERARHAAAAGDTALAIEELDQAAARSSAGPANVARIAIARLKLASVTDPAELGEVRRILLPALGDQAVRPLIHAIGMIGTLLEGAAAGQPLALFAAAEISRDRLGAPALARRFFVSYADLAGPGPWSTKALLSALQLDPPLAQATTLQSRFASATDIYAIAARGSVPDGFEDAEMRLDQVLADLVARADRATQQRDAAVGEAIAQLDSITSAAHADSLTLACGSLADSLGLAGIRRDSVSAACLREDVVLVESFLLVDTVALRDGVGADPDRPALPPVADTTAQSEIQ